MFIYKIIGSSRRKNILESAGVFSKVQLTPRKKRLSDLAAEYVSLSKVLANENKMYSSKIEALTKASKPEELIRGKLSKVGETFLLQQIRLHLKPKYAHRFSLEEKILSLAFYKASPRGYRLWEKAFTMPSKRTLLRLLENIKMSPGINNHLLKNLIPSVNAMEEQNKLCVLVFDEMAITSALFYDPLTDEVIGIPDNGSEKTIGLGDHMMVFMIKGIVKRFKQPFAFFISDGPMKSDMLAVQIKKAITALQNIGLRVVGTVCDQFDKGAINKLVEETKQNLARNGRQHCSYTFNVNDNEIMPIFDPPHLLKGIRNNFMKGEAQFVMGGVTKTAKWRHLIELFQADNNFARETSFNHNENNSLDYRALPFLTTQHLIPSKMPKMKVNIAAQVFSQRVSCTLRHWAGHGYSLNISKFYTLH